MWFAKRKDGTYCQERIINPINGSDYSEYINSPVIRIEKIPQTLMYLGNGGFLMEMV